MPGVRSILAYAMLRLWPSFLCRCVRINTLSATLICESPIAGRMRVFHRATLPDVSRIAQAIGFRSRRPSATAYCRASSRFELKSSRIRDTPAKGGERKMTRQLRKNQLAGMHRYLQRIGYSQGRTSAYRSRNRDQKKSRFILNESTIYGQHAH